VGVKKFFAATQRIAKRERSFGNDEFTKRKTHSGGVKNFATRSN